MMDMTLVGRADAHAHPGAAYDGRKGIEYRHTNHHDRGQQHGQAGLARVEQCRCQAQGEAQKKRARITKKNLGRVEIPAEETERGACDRGA